MPATEIWKCDHCHKIIEQPRDVYRLEMKGENWEQADPAGGHSDTMRNAKKLGFCESCSRQIVRALAAIGNQMTEEQREIAIHTRMKDTDKIPTAPGAYNSARRALAIEQLTKEGIL
jgi:hypothetical protein